MRFHENSWNAVWHFAEGPNVHLLNIVPFLTYEDALVLPVVGFPGNLCCSFIGFLKDKGCGISDLHNVENYLHTPLASWFMLYLLALRFMLQFEHTVAFDIIWFCKQNFKN